MDKVIPITKSSAPPFDEFIEEISEIWDSRAFTNISSKVNKLETELAKFLGSENLTLFANGHFALEAAIASLNNRGDIITTPFTFASTILSIVRNGYNPIFCDINKYDYTIDCDKIENLITENTKAILPVHVFGNICDINKLNYLSSKYNIPIIYDAAHTFGVQLNDIDVANFGDISMLSFHASKVFHCIEGGCLVYKDAKLRKFFSQFRNFGFENNISVVNGANLKMSEVHASMGICNLRHIDTYIESRQKCANVYKRRLSCVNGLIINEFKSCSKHNYGYYPIQIVKKDFGYDRNNVHDILLKNNVISRKYFYPLVSQLPIFNNKYFITDTPVAHEVSNNILTLPLYSDLRLEDVEYICDLIVKMNIFPQKV